MRRDNEPDDDEEEDEAEEAVEAVRVLDEEGMVVGIGSIATFFSVIFGVLEGQDYTIVYLVWDMCKIWSVERGRRLEMNGHTAHFI